MVRGDCRAYSLRKLCGAHLQSSVLCSELTKDGRRIWLPPLGCRPPDWTSVLTHVILTKLKTDEESSSPSQELTCAVCTLGSRKLQLSQKEININDENKGFLFYSFVSSVGLLKCRLFSRH